MDVRLCVCVGRQRYVGKNVYEYKHTNKQTYIHSNIHTNIPGTGGRLHRGDSVQSGQPAGRDWEAFSRECSSRSAGERGGHGSRAGLRRALRPVTHALKPVKHAMLQVRGTASCQCCLV